MKLPDSSEKLVITIFALLWVTTLLIVSFLILESQDLKHQVGTQLTLLGAVDEKPNATHGESASRLQQTVLRQHQSGLENNPDADEE